MSDKLQTLANTLELHSVSYEISPSEPVTTWLKDNFPIADWGRVLWSSIDSARCESYTDLAHASQIINRLILNEGLGNPSVIILFSNAISPAIEIGLDTFTHFAPEIITQDFDLWICCKEDSWCLEIYHENEICWGRTKIWNQRTQSP